MAEASIATSCYEAAAAAIVPCSAVLAETTSVSTTSDTGSAIGGDMIAVASTTTATRDDIASASSSRGDTNDKVDNAVPAGLDFRTCDPATIARLLNENENLCMSDFIPSDNGLWDDYVPPHLPEDFFSKLPPDHY